MTGRTVVIFGGGIGGLSAALELAERGFVVTLYEERPGFGGKARTEPAVPKPYPSANAPGPAAPGPAAPVPAPAGNGDLPGEHGFRFFPGFYRHLPDTMARIPAPPPHGWPASGAASTAADHLVECPAAMLAQRGRPPVIVPTGTARTWRERREQLEGLRLSRWGLSLGDAFHAAGLFLRVLCSCEARRETELEAISWWDYSGAATRSPAYQHVVGGLIRTFVAARPQEMSARTAAQVTIQLLFTGKSAEIADRVLDGPTSEVLIGPWVAQLEALGVRLVADAPLQRLDTTGGRVAAASIVQGGNPVEVSADHYVVALPADRLLAVVEASPALGCPSLEGLGKLVQRWMTGIQFFLAVDEPIVAGHTVYLDAEWALTSISQAQFWPGVDLSGRTEGHVRGVLSVDICNFDLPGANGKPASACTADEIAVEVWRQLQAEVPALQQVTPVGYHLDEDLTWSTSSSLVNSEPMLINTAGSLALRPKAATELSNLYLACDAVRTTTDLATMEGANEAARRAVNALLDRAGSTAARCQLFPLREPALFRPLRAIDAWRYRLTRRFRRHTG